MIKNLLFTIILFTSIPFSANAQLPPIENKQSQSLNESQSDTEAKYLEMKEELNKVKEESRNQLLKRYATEWQRYRYAQSPGILHQKKKIEKEALQDGFTVEEIKKYLESLKTKNNEK